MLSRRAVLTSLAGLASWAVAGTAAARPAKQSPAADDVPAVRGETPRPYGAEHDVEPEVRAAVAASRADGRVVLVVFGGNWCVWCRRLDYELRHDPVLAPVVERGFRVIHADHRANEALVRRYGNPVRLGLPVIVVLGPGGAPIHTQDSSALELGPGHSRTRILAFLRRFHA